MSTAIRRLAPSFILDRRQAGERAGLLAAATLFVDISGFTRLTETLMQHEKDGAEILTEVLNGIFSPIVGRVYGHGGFISTFAGDAFTAIFPGEGKDTASRALAAAQYVNHFFAQQGEIHTKYGDFHMGVKVGAAVGEVEWGILGLNDSLTYFFRGQAVDAAAAAEHHASQGEIILTPDFAAVAGEATASEAVDGHVRVLRVQGALPQPQPPALREQGREALRPFVMDAVLDMTLRAEFRTVCSVFLSFDEPESVAALDDFASAVLTLTQSYGGYFNKLDFGDKGGVMLILFGAPIAHEENVERAADFLLALQGMPQTLPWRAGMTAGTVYAGIMGGEERCEYTAIGDIVNLSARLMMAAPWGEIWAGRRVAAELAATHLLADLGRFQFKGKGGLIPAFRLLRKQSTTASTLYAGRLVGRDEEMEALAGWLQPLFEEEARTPAGVTYIYGEPGIGKSRLLYELRRRLEKEQNLRWLYCPSESILRESLNPFKYALRGFFKQSPDHDAARNRAAFDRELEALREALPAGGEARALRQELLRTRSMLAAMVDLRWEGSLYERLDPKLRFENTLTACVTLLRALSLLRPVVLEFDDTQYMDGDSAELLRLLAADCRDHRLALFISSRYQDDGSRLAFALPEDIPTRALDLNYLTPAGSAAFLEGILGLPLEEKALAFLIEKTNGNPYFLEQLALYLREQDFFREVSQDEEALLSLPALSGDDVPTSINAVLISRLDRLAAEVKNVVLTAAVLGREFELQALLAMLHEDTAGLVQVRRAEGENIWSALGEIRYLFRHALLRDSAYDMQLRSRLRELHRLAAAALEQLHGEELNAYAADLAYHYEKAGLREETLRYLWMAANQAREDYRNESALALYDRLLAHVEAGPERVRALEYKGDLLGNLSEYDAAIAAYEMALEELAGQREEEQRAELARKVGMVYVSKGEYQQALVWLGRARGFVKKAQSRAAARIALATAGTLYRQGEAGQALEWCERGLEMATSLDDAGVLTHAHRLRGTIHTGLGALAEAIQDFEASLALAKAGDDLVQQMTADNSLGAVYYYRGEWDQAITHYRRSLDIAEEIGHIEQQATVSNNLGEVYLIRGQFQEAVERFQNCLQTWMRTGFQIGVALSHRNLAQLALNQQDWAQARTHTDAGLALMAKMGSKDWVLADLQRLVAELHLSQGELAAAAESCRRSLDLALSQEIKLVEVNARRVLGRVHLTGGAWEEAEQDLQSSLALARELGMQHEEGQALLELARLYGLRGDEHGQAQSAAYLRQAVDRFEALDAAWDAGRARALAAEMGMPAA